MRKLRSVPKRWSPKAPASSHSAATRAVGVHLPSRFAGPVHGQFYVGIYVAHATNAKSGIQAKARVPLHLQLAERYVTQGAPKEG